MNKIKFIKNIEILKEETDPEILLVKATGVASMKDMIAPVLVSSNNDNSSQDGIYELEFILGTTGEEEVEVEMEVDVVYKLKKLPHWVKGIKIKATENSDIELI